MPDTIDFVFDDFEETQDRDYAFVPLPGSTAYEDSISYADTQRDDVVEDSVSYAETQRD
jgi:hypothetical protein